MHYKRRFAWSARFASSGTGTFNQCWTLDATGNWKGFREDDTGSGTWDLVQSRTTNTVNEITGITNSTGTAWATPAYDANGNMTTLPKPAAPQSALTGTYDAWNRLVKLVDAAGSPEQLTRRLLEAVEDLLA